MKPATIYFWVFASGALLGVLAFGLLCLAMQDPITTQPIKHVSLNKTACYRVVT